MIPTKTPETRTPPPPLPAASAAMAPAKAPASAPAKGTPRAWKNRCARDGRSGSVDIEVWVNRRERVLDPHESVIGVPFDEGNKPMGTIAEPTS
ncbi:MAG: hypothetical protein IBJ11_06590 [Phycisphaerales bacterium]|nr:hypothetical protein [Phycisphaerales bacterium]